MLATLNLQLSPIELLVDTPTTSVSLLPDAGTEATSGFAHLLRLRVDVPSTADLTVADLPREAGELPSQPALSLPESGGSLPQSGSGLPIPVRQLSAQLASETLPTIPADKADISLETAVLYPPLENPPAELTASLVLPPGPLASTAVRIDSTIGVVETDASDSAIRPQVAARLQTLLAVAGERFDTPAAATDLRERGQPIVPQTRPQLTVPIAQAADANESLPVVDLPKRPEFQQVQSAGSVAEQLTELIRPRGVVPQPVQTLHAQLNTQPSQAMFVATPSSVAAGELTYAAAAQQAMDLIGTPVRDSAWGEQLSERVVLMASNQFKTAEIRLTPAELGPLRVQVAVDDGAANVTFHSQHAVTREAIEQALPRLREMLAENGLSLGQADVSEQNVAQGNKDGETDGRLSNQSADEGQDAAADDAGHAALRAKAANGLVDTFA
jgi:flagellar hook-length control protein FliK